MLKIAILLEMPVTQAGRLRLQSYGEFVASAWECNSSLILEAVGYEYEKKRRGEALRREIIKTGSRREDPGF